MSNMWGLSDCGSSNGIKTFRWVSDLQVAGQAGPIDTKISKSVHGHWNRFPMRLFCLPRQEGAVNLIYIYVLLFCRVDILQYFFFWRLFETDTQYTEARIFDI
jgi:hypothetical protein